MKTTFSHSLETGCGLVAQPACADSTGNDVAQGSQTLLQSPCSSSGVFSLHKYCPFAQWPFSWDLILGGKM